MKLNLNMKCKYVFAAFLLAFFTSPGFSSELREEERQQEVITIHPHAVLPDELMIHIFSLLNKGSVPAVTRVCKEWHRFMEDKNLWKMYAARALRGDISAGDPSIDYRELVKSFCIPSFRDLGVLEGGLESSANAMSFDGSIIAGYATVGDARSEHKAVVWSKEGEIKLLGQFNEESESEVTAMNYDGSVMVGYATKNPSLHKPLAVVWSKEGNIKLLDELSKEHESKATAMNHDGSIVVGYVRNDRYPKYSEACIWKKGEPIKFLGIFEGGSYSKGTAISLNGDIIVGDADNTSHASTAFIWTADTGMQALQELHPTYESDESKANAVSCDGSIIVGHNYAYDSGSSEA